MIFTNGAGTIDIYDVMIELYLLSFDWILKVTTVFTTSLARQTLIPTMQQEVSSSLIWAGYSVRNTPMLQDAERQWT